MPKSKPVDRPRTDTRSIQVRDPDGRLASALDRLKARALESDPAHVHNYATVIRGLVFAADASPPPSN